MSKSHVTVTTARSGALWQVMQFPLTRVIVAALPIFIVMAMTEIVIRALALVPGTLISSLIVVANGAISVALYAGYVRWIEQRKLIELSGTGAVRELIFGSASGLGLFLVPAGTLVLLGVGQIDPGAGVTTVIPSLLWVIGTIVPEELLFRGVIFRIAEQRLGSWIALAIAALLFGGLNAANANASIVSTLAIAVEAGVLLAIAYMATRRLWLPIAIHAGWNFAQLGLLGVQRPGHAIRGLWSSRFVGPPLLSGGDWGPEISILSLSACLLASLVLLAIARRRGRLLSLPRPARRAGPDRRHHDT